MFPDSFYNIRRLHDGEIMCSNDELEVDITTKHRVGIFSQLLFVDNWVVVSTDNENLATLTRGGILLAESLPDLLPQLVLGLDWSVSNARHEGRDKTFVMVNLMRDGFFYCDIWVRS